MQCEVLEKLVEVRSSIYYFYSVSLLLFTKLAFSNFKIAA